MAIHKYLDISTDAVTALDMEFIRRGKQCIAWYPEGAFVYLPAQLEDGSFDDPLWHCTMREMGFSLQFIRLIEAARALGCQYIRLDASGNKELPQAPCATVSGGPKGGLGIPSLLRKLFFRMHEIEAEHITKSTYNGGDDSNDKPPTGDTYNLLWDAILDETRASIDIDTWDELWDQAILSAALPPKKPATAVELLNALHAEMEVRDGYPPDTFDRIGVILAMLKDGHKPD